MNWFSSNRKEVKVNTERILEEQLSIFLSILREEGLFYLFEYVDGYYRIPNRNIHISPNCNIDANGRAITLIELIQGLKIMEADLRKEQYKDTIKLFENELDDFTAYVRDVFSDVNIPMELKPTFATRFSKDDASYTYTLEIIIDDKVILTYTNEDLQEYIAVKHYQPPVWQKITGDLEKKYYRQ